MCAAPVAKIPPSRRAPLSRALPRPTLSGWLADNGLSGWTLGATIGAATLALPIVAILALALRPSDSIWDHLVATVLPGAVGNTLMLMLGAGGLSLIVGTSAAWLVTMYKLQTFAKHYQTGEPVPTELVMKMRRADEFAKGLGVRRQMVYADLSLSIYNQDPAKVDIEQITRDLVKRYQPFAFVEGTHFPCSFGHLDGYSAVYYTYMWSLVIAKDMFSAFDQDNLLDPVIAAKYRAAVLAPGGSKPAAKLVEDFLGRPFGFEAYQRWLDRVN